MEQGEVSGITSGLHSLKVCLYGWVICWGFIYRIVHIMNLYEQKEDTMKKETEEQFLKRRGYEILQIVNQIRKMCKTETITLKFYPSGWFSTNVEINLKEK